MKTTSEKLELFLELEDEMRESSGQEYSADVWG